MVVVVEIKTDATVVNTIGVVDACEVVDVETTVGVVEDVVVVVVVVAVVVGMKTPPPPPPPVLGAE